MVFERVRMLLRFKRRAAADKVVRKSRHTEREELRKPRNKRIRKGGGWSTGFKLAGRMQTGRNQQLLVGSPHNLSW